MTRPCHILCNFLIPNVSGNVKTQEILTFTQGNGAFLQFFCPLLSVTLMK